MLSVIETVFKKMNLFWFVFLFRAVLLLRLASSSRSLCAKETVVKIIANSELVRFHCIIRATFPWAISRVKKYPTFCRLLPLSPSSQLDEEQIGVAAMFVTRIREVFSSNLGRTTG
jgi:hypothetical protein